MRKAIDIDIAAFGPCEIANAAGTGRWNVSSTAGGRRLTGPKGRQASFAQTKTPAFPPGFPHSLEA